MTTAHAPVHPFRCRKDCAAAGRHRDHHDRLLTVDTDADALLELIEIAVTWHELDYSESPVLGPSDWLTFAAAHRWTRADRAERVFGLAVDIVGRRAAGAAADVGLAEVIDLVRR